MNHYSTIPNVQRMFTRMIVYLATFEGHVQRSAVLLTGIHHHAALQHVQAVIYLCGRRFTNGKRNGNKRVK